MDIEQVFSWNRPAVAAVEALLRSQNLKPEEHLDYTCAMFDAQGRAVATGSCFENTLRCFAVSPEYRGEGLLNALVSHLIAHQAAEGRHHLFVYTKPQTAPMFADLGFYPIVETDSVVFLENRRHGFEAFVQGLARQVSPHRQTAAIVMNANPFTLGHLALVQWAAGRYEQVCVFVVSEDKSLVPFSVRMSLVRQGTRDIPNVIVLETGPYLISSATFPGYFLKDREDAYRAQAALDAHVFLRMAHALRITARVVGTEPASLVTQSYNAAMQALLPPAGVRLDVMRRAEHDHAPISASAVRRLLRQGDVEAIRPLVPPTTYQYFLSPEAAPVLRAIREADEVAHH